MTSHSDMNAPARRLVHELWDGQAMNSMGEAQIVERVLVVDDDDEIRELVSRSLERHGYEVASAGSVPEAEDQLRRRAFDLVILDIMMPGEDGLSFCRRLAGTSGPLIMILSALDGSADRIVGLELGADAYLPKPCEPRELVAHVKATLRRSRRLADARDAGRSAEFERWQIDLSSRLLRDPEGVHVDLSTSEFQLLRAFVERPKRVLSREQLLDAVHPNDRDIFDRAIDVQVSRLRRKLGEDGPRYIRTVRSEGYMFTPSVVRR